MVESVLPAAVAHLGTFVVAAAFYALTAHLAALFVVGDVPPTKALLVGPVPAAVLVVVGSFSLPVATVLALLADFGAIKTAYETDLRIATATTVLHFAISFLLAWSVLGLLGVSWF